MTTGETVPAKVSDAARAVYRALIDRLITTGEVADDQALVEATGYGRERIAALLAELIARDWVAADATEKIVAVYPFSPTPTGIGVTLATGTTRQAMCALDALGTAPMLAQRVTIESRCVQCDTPLMIDVAPDRLRGRSPRSMVVVRRRTPGIACAARCDATRFACSPDHAEAWIDAYGGPDDVMQSLEATFIDATRRFGDCYRTPDRR